MSGLVPLVGITSGRCFAGNAALLGCCDVIIATKGSNIGMGGPAMIEGGGLGVFRPEEIGPIDVQAPNGVVDVRSPTKPKRCASPNNISPTFRDAVSDWTCADQRLLRASFQKTACGSTTSARSSRRSPIAGSVLELRPQLRPRHDHRASSASKAGRSA